MLLDKIASVSRLNPDTADADKESYQAVGNYNAIKINVQPATAELTAISEGKYGQTYRAFVAVSGILIGDRITISGTGGKVFTVKGIDDWMQGLIPHMELVLFEGDN